MIGSDVRGRVGKRHNVYRVVYIATNEPMPAELTKMIIFYGISGVTANRIAGASLRCTERHSRIVALIWLGRTTS
jgi:hypothetical protein